MFLESSQPRLPPLLIVEWVQIIQQLCQPGQLGMLYEHNDEGQLPHELAANVAGPDVLSLLGMLPRDRPHDPKKVGCQITVLLCAPLTASRLCITTACAKPDSSKTLNNALGLEISSKATKAYELRWEATRLEPLRCSCMCRRELRVCVMERAVYTPLLNL